VTVPTVYYFHVEYCLCSAIFEAMPRLDLELAPANNARRAIILSLPAQIEAEILPPDIADAIRGLWRGTSASLPTPTFYESNLLARRPWC
jgi:hypothetical protein